MNLFGSSNLILETITKKNQENKKGIYSICSSNTFVVKSCMQIAKRDNSILLIESTCNQVNQYGGYSGMRPLDFAMFVSKISKEVNFPQEKIILGGDHLGPYPWKNDFAKIAMGKSEQMIKEYITAGYRKIHLDASMPCKDDNLSREFTRLESAKRAVKLCKVAENQELSNSDKPVYIIGTEVPTPGGQLNMPGELKITSPQEVLDTIEIYKTEFYQEGLESAWERVIAIVVQPGVEFSNCKIQEYVSENALGLKNLIMNIPGMVYEAHSTDYQTRENLRQMVIDNFIILKVGPALTFAFREVVFALATIEEMLLTNRNDLYPSNIIKIICSEMDNVSNLWIDYICKSESLFNFARLYGFSDRVRYLWNTPKIKLSIYRLISNLEKIEIPLTLISQFLPKQYRLIREKIIKNNPQEIIIAGIIDVVENYSFACGLSNVIEKNY